jgi:cation diffusion facilitator CzcD-associated flavoprotein CzcO
MAEHLDVIIVGAGISGIDAAYHLQTRCPDKTFAILDGRERLGGTWDLFRYPGIRSDSDMYTLGFPFRPWTNPDAIADGQAILTYLEDTAAEFGIDRKIRFGHRVTTARWSTPDARWTLGLDDGTTLTCGFLFVCAGYYDYAHGFTPEFAGRERFRGTIVHPQAWPKELDYRGKRVVVIGSGATAVTLVPELAKQASHVTMLQRSPTYVASLPKQDPIANYLRGKLSPASAYAVTRWKNVLVGMGFYAYCRRFPAHAKRLLVRQVTKLAQGSVDVGAHFTPSYQPWDQRLCFVPDADLFHALRDGRASVVTDHITTFTETGIALRSGAVLDAAIIVTATGLELLGFGGITFAIDGAAFAPPAHMVYRGMMMSGMPNLAFSIGYTNASWTLKCDLTSRYVCRLLNHMTARHYRSCTPRRDPTVGELPIIDFSSGYVQRALDRFPVQGDKLPWKLFQNYVLDYLMMGRGRLEDGVMQFAR